MKKTRKAAGKSQLSSRPGKRSKAKTPKINLENPTLAASYQEMAFNRIIAMSAQAYLVMKALEKHIPEKARKGTHIKSVAELASELRRSVWASEDFGRRILGIMDAVGRFAKKVQPKGTERLHLSWKILRESVTFSPVLPPPVVYSAEGFTPEQVEELLEEFRRSLIEFLERLKRLVNDAEAQKKIEELIRRIREGRTWRELVNLAGEVSGLVERLKRFLTPQQIYDLIHKLRGLAETIGKFLRDNPHLIGGGAAGGAGGAQAGAALIEPLIVIILCLLAFLIGIAIGTSINKIQKENEAQNLSDDLGEWIYKKFFESETDALLAAQDVLIWDLGDYEEKIRGGEKLNEDERKAAIEKILSLIALCQKKLDLDVEPRDLVLRRMLAATRMLNELMGLTPINP